MYNTFKHLASWYQRPIKVLLGGFLIVLVVMLTLVGGVFFWTTKFSSAFLTQANDRGELEIARSGLQTMKRMVSDPQAWSDSVKEEYNKLFAVRPVEAELTAGDASYDDNFVDSKHAADGDLTKLNK